MLKQREMIQAIYNKGKQDPSVDSILMYGSFTQEAGDSYSDIEFYIFIQDSDYSNFHSKAWIESVHPIYSHFFNEFGTEAVIFSNLIRGEFHFLPISKMNIIDSFTIVGYFPDTKAMCLYDENGRLQKSLGVLKDAEINRHTKESIESTLHQLIDAILFGVNVYRRGEIARSMERLYFAQKYYLQLLRLLENQTHHWINPFKSLEKELSNEAYQSFKNAISSLENESVYSAYNYLFIETRKLISKLSLEYPLSDFKPVMNHLQSYIENT